MPFDDTTGFSVQSSFGDNQLSKNIDSFTMGQWIATRRINGLVLEGYCPLLF